jgi:hypothetical protein
MGDWRCKNMSQLEHVTCPCEKGILTVVAEVGVESYGNFQVKKLPELIVF